MRNFLKAVTGAKDEELVRVVASFFALLLLLMSYYMLKPLRTSYFLKEFDPEWQRRFLILLPFPSLVVTRIFNHFYSRLERFQLVAWTYGLIIACKLVFMLVLPTGGQAVIVTFYLFMTVYFLLSMAAMWACLSSIFSSMAGERTFAFISFGGMIGAMLGSHFTGTLGRSAYKNYAFLASAILMLGALGMLYLALRSSPGDATKRPDQGQTNNRPLLTDLRELWNHRYLRGIAVMVFSLAVMNTVLDLVSIRVIDERMYEIHYQGRFPELPEEGFELIYGLKELPEDTRLARVGDWLAARDIDTNPEDLMLRYEVFRELLETETRLFNSKVYYYISLFGLLVMLLAARPLFRFVGVRRLLALLPCLFLLCITGLLLLPIDLTLIAIFLVATNTLNYSLNKTSKELLYTETDDQSRFRFKPIIAGPVRRLGDLTAALVQVICADLLMVGERWSETILIVLGVPLTLWWLSSVWSAGADYQKRRRRRELEESQEEVRR